MAKDKQRIVYNEKLIQAIKKYILEDENKEEVVNELKRYKSEFRYCLGYNWYAYGNILPYYSQIRDFYKENGIEASEDNSVLQKHFEKHIQRAIDEILKENS